MTTTTISTSNQTRRLSAMLHDAFHVRTLVFPEDVSKAKRESQPRSQRNRQQSLMLTTFAGRYGGQHF